MSDSWVSLRALSLAHLLLCAHVITSLWARVPLDSSSQKDSTQAGLEPIFVTSFELTYHFKLDFPGGSDGEESPAVQETRVQCLGQEDPLEKEWQPTAVFLPGKLHGQRSLAGHCPWGHKESDTTE